MKPPILILVRPQLGENIGMCARAMLNCGLERLRLVKPREPWPNPKAVAAAADADAVLDQVELFDSVAEAVADCHRVLATTARMRVVNLPVMEPGEAMTTLQQGDPEDQVAILFGPESAGLRNEALKLVDGLIRFPTNPEFSSLNLAQAVLLLSWEWQRALGSFRNESNAPAAANKEDLSAFLKRLEDSLEVCGFFTSPDRRTSSEAQLAAFFGRARPSDNELRILHGVVSALRRGPYPGEEKSERGEK